jgi:uncharacterized metal-binding protein YceD (DUF177 family)
MTAPAPEFSRPLPVDRIPQGGSREKIAADVNELNALAARFGLPALHALRAELHATPWRGGLKLEGSLTADLEQISVVSLEAFRQQVEFPILRYFMPAGVIRDVTDAEIDPIEHGQVDLGEVVSETLALELDPYPRQPGEAFDQTIWAEETSPSRSSPFASLTRLKPK